MSDITNKQTSKQANNNSCYSDHCTFFNIRIDTEIMCQKQKCEILSIYNNKRILIKQFFHNKGEEEEGGKGEEEKEEAKPGEKMTFLMGSVYL